MSAELSMFEDASIEFVADLVEVIHVELPHEGGEVAVAEVGWQDLLLEPFNIQDSEVNALLIPAHDARVLVTLKDLVCLGDEDGGT